MWELAPKDVDGKRYVDRGTENRIKNHIGVRRVDDLLPHEDVSSECKSQVKYELEQKKMFLYPIVVEKRTGIVLDGNTRLHVATKHFGLRALPVVELDYENDVDLRAWARYIDRREGGFDMGSLVSQFRLEDQADGENDGRVEVFGRDGSLRAEYRLPRGLDQYGECQKVVDIEDELGKSDGCVHYVADEDLENGYRPQHTPEGKREFVTLHLPRLEPRIVIDVATSGRTFPKKTTRHIFPFRISMTRIPLDACRDFDACENWIRGLENTRVKYFGKGVWVQLYSGGKYFPEHFYEFAGPSDGEAPAHAGDVDHPA